ncbi:4012_t:CDS:2, partial [Scutellospora calospora]
LHLLFQIPSQTPISLSYTDEDGDIITLSSDLEFKDILSDQELFGSSIKFVLSTPDEFVTNETDSWVLEGSAAQIEEGLSQSIKDSDVVSFSSSDEDTSPITVDESQEQNSNEPQQSFVFTEPSESQKNPNYKHVTITDEETEEPTFKPTIIGQQPETSGEPSSSSISLCHKNDDDDDEGNDERFCSWNKFGSRFKFGRCHKRRWNRNNQCYQLREYDNGNFNEEVVAEKVKVLRDMGFEGENFEELVKLYNGNIDFVIETLLQQ